MIDDYAKAMELMRKMEAQLPIPARPTGAFVRVMRERGVHISRDQELQIESVFYMGDEGGISCSLTPLPGAREAIVVSITHLRVGARHPLGPEIREYQKERTHRLAQAGGSKGITSFTLDPRKKWKR